MLVGGLMMVFVLNVYSVIHTQYPMHDDLLAYSMIRGMCMAHIDTKHIRFPHSACNIRSNMKRT